MNSQNGLAQLYAPAAGQLGSTAYYKDSSAFVAWASACSVNRGWQDVSSPSLGLSSSGESSLAIGKADVAGVVSLGDGGFAVCQFQNAITNGSGFDFAVFENSFNDDFLELAFVEVSSDGVHFFRFPAHSLSDTLNQCGSFGSTDANKVNNLAGKYRGGFGTPFDLQELSGIAGLDIQHISHIKIIDVIGSLDKSLAQRDNFNNKVNDPWPTPFPSGGFDLDAIGVMHQLLPNTINGMAINNRAFIYPNPSTQGDLVYLSNFDDLIMVKLFDLQGAIIRSFQSKELDTKELTKGIYFLQIETKSKSSFVKLLIN
ncbi:MAG: T9SS type A sorting domain-containing protein [Bacteroidota bacterium]